MAFPADHPLRRSLNAEIHSRPYAQLRSPQRFTQLALLTGEDGAEADRTHFNRLLELSGMPPVGAEVNHTNADFGAFLMKWERHTEFCSYTVFEPRAAGDDAAPFDLAALRLLPESWVADLPGELLVGVQGEIVPGGGGAWSAEDVGRLLRSDTFAGSEVTGGAARAFMNFAIGEDGFGRILVVDDGLKPRQAGRLVQRLLEIDTYSMMALLALPVARSLGPITSRFARQLQDATEAMAGLESLEDERRMLDDLARIAAEAERHTARSAYRFSAARAYDALAQRRIVELRETRIEGQQTVSEFIDRRLAPAMRTCEAVAQRMDRLTARVARATEMLRTRVDVKLEGQNRDLLESMDRRARLQMRLQETVEGLSVAAISYYLVSLVGYAAKAAKAGGLLHVDPAIVMGLSIPLVAAAVWFGVRRVRRMIERHSGSGTDGSN